MESPFCGCMNDEVVEDFNRVLLCLGNGYKYYDDVSVETGLAENYLLALYQIATDAKLLEHGSGIRGSWLTLLGEQYVRESGGVIDTTDKVESEQSANEGDNDSSIEPKGE